MKGKNIKRVVALALAMVMAFAVLPGGVFRLFADTVSLEKLSEAPGDGDRVVIYHATGGVLGTAASGSKLAAVAAAPDEEGKIALAEGMALLTVGVSDGQYTFSLEDGTYLTSGETGSKLSFESELSDLGRWTLEQQEDGSWYLMNVGAAYNGNHNQALEYYSGFTTYGVKTNNAAYKFDFYGPEEADDHLVPDGDYVIYNPANNIALSGEYSGFYNLGESIEIEDVTQVQEVDAKIIWHVTNNEDGSVTISNGEGKLSMDTSYSSTPLDKVNDTWEIVETGTEGLYGIRNIGRNLFLEYYASKGTFSGYGTSCSDPLFQFNFVPAKEKGEEPPLPPDPPQPEETLLAKLSEAPEDGAEVVIYHATGGVLGTAASGSKLAAVAATPDEEGKIALAEGMALLTVGVSEGQYTFSLEDGTYLTSGETGNKLSFESELSDLGRWTLEHQEDGSWYLMNVGAAYNGNHNQALEYYNGFTTYGVKANNAAYKFDFYGPEEADDHLVPDGDYVIYNPAHNVAVSAEYSGYYNKAESITIEDVTKVQEVPESLIWHVTNNEDGTLTISYGEQNWGMAASYSSITLGAENDTWELVETETEGLYLIKNVGRELYIEYYAKNANFSGYANLAQIDLFQFNFVPAKVQEEQEGVLKDGDQVVIYNPGEGASLGMPNELGSALAQAPTEIEDGKAIATNGARVFTVGVEGDYYTFYSGDEGYLATNNGESLFFVKDLADDAATACTYWTLTQNGESYIIYNKTANYNGSKVCIEAFGGAFSGWTFKSADKDLFLFQFYPVTEDTLVVNGIVDKPEVIFTERNAYKLTDYELEFKVVSIFNFDLQATQIIVNGEVMYPERVSTTDVLNYTMILTIPAEMLEGTSLEIEVRAEDEHGAHISGTISIPIIDEPFIKDMTPERGAETGDDKRPEIGATISNYGENPTVVMKINGEVVSSGFNLDTGRVSYIPPQDMEDGKVTVEITVTRADGVSSKEQWSFWIGEASFALYFGQLHSHTAEYSDGAGTLAAALEYIANLPEFANVQFVAFTDHSNYFDTSGSPNPEAALYDTTQMTAESLAKWDTYTKLTREFNESHSDVIALSGFEMTWSGGPGHINTFVTPGIVSRNNKTLNNKTNDAGMKAYYALLDAPELEDSISQFNHPGATFGNFKDFAYYDPVTDSRMYLVEVGNGEGQIGAGGYYPSYEQYVMALDKGWHVAPTNNQDNHKGSWGNANNARDVIITDDFSTEGLYAAIRQYRVYSTEDKNLEVLYNVNELPMGSIISEVPESLDLSVSVYDPDGNDSITKVEVVVNSGKTIYTWNDPSELASGELSVTLDPDYSYYFIRVTEGDGDLAVTAPVWVGESLKLGISSFESGTDIPVTGEAVKLTTTLFNSEASDATVTSLTYTIDGSEVAYTDTTGYTVPKSGTVSAEYQFTPLKAKLTKITVTAVVELEGKEYTFTKDVELDVKDADSLVYVGIDASHYNEYVSGNYKDSMGNFALLASEYSVRVVTLETSEDLIAACGNEKYKGLIFTAPSRRLEAAQQALLYYTDEEIAAVKSFNENGGFVVVAGWSDYYENYPDVLGDMDASLHMAAVQNSLLEALGTELRVNDDATHDDSLHGGQTQRLYFNAYNMDNFLMEGVEVDEEHPNDRLYTEVYSHYGGCSISTTSGSVPETVTPAVFGHATTYSKDSDNDGIGGSSIPKYLYAEGDERLLITATDEQEGKGVIVVSGAAFMSNFEVQATIEDSNAEKNYANYKVCENLLKRLNPMTITPIAEVREVTEPGYLFTIEGIVTSNASGYDKDTAFFDCIYVQDETAGICCFPVAGEYKIGDVVRITGSTDFYQAEPELQVKSIETIGEAECPDPEEITAAQENNRSKEGLLVKVSGTITQVDVVDGQLQTILYTDDSGETGRIFIDGYITTIAAGYEDVANAAVGNKVTATGLASYDDTFNAPEGPFPRIRIRNRADVVCEVVEEELTVLPYSETAFTEGEDYVVRGRNVTVKGDRIVKIGYLDGDSYVLCDLTITEDEEGTHYVYSVPEGVDEVVLVLKGDADLSGEFDFFDVVTSKAMDLYPEDDYTAIQLFAADVDDDGEFTFFDVILTKAADLGKTPFSWQ